MSFRDTSVCWTANGFIHCSNYCSRVSKSLLNDTLLFAGKSKYWQRETSFQGPRCPISISVWYHRYCNWILICLEVLNTHTRTHTHTHTHIYIYIYIYIYIEVWRCPLSFERIILESIRYSTNIRLQYVLKFKKSNISINAYILHNYTTRLNLK